jgi:autotransporter-associated beta strand protein
MLNLNVDSPAPSVDIIGTGTATINIASGKTLTSNQSSASTYAGVLAGAGSFTKAGVGSLTPAGANTYTGVTKLDGGNLFVTSLADINTASPIGKGSVAGSAADLVFGGGILYCIGATAPTSTNRLFTIGDANGLSATIYSDTSVAANTLSFTSAGSIAFGGSCARSLTLRGLNTGNNTFAPIIGDGPGGATSVTKTDTGTWILAGANTYSGGTDVERGTLTVNGGSTIGAIQRLTVSSFFTNSPSVLNLNVDQTVGLLQGTIGGTGTATINIASTKTLTSNQSSSTTYAGVLAGAGAFTKSGTGTLTLSGTAANTYTGLTTVNAGELDLNKTAGVNAIGGNVTIGDGTGTDTLKLLAANQIADTSVVTLTIGGSAVLNLNGNSETIGSLTDSGSGASTASVQLGAGTLTFGDTTGRTYGGVISGIGGQLVKQGAGTQTFSGASANTYSGLTTVNAGELDLNKTAGVTAIPGDVTIGDGSGTDTLKLLAANQISDTSVVTLTIGGSAVFNLNGNNETIGSLTDSAVGTSGASVLLGAGILTFGDASNRTYGGVISGTGGQLVKQGTGTETLSGANTYTGTTLIATNGGTLKIDNNNTTTARLSGTSLIHINSGGTLLLAQSGVTASNDRINNSAAMELNGGTFNTGGLSEHGALNNTAGIGALTLQSSSIIDMGNGASICLANSLAQAASGTLLTSAGQVPVTGRHRSTLLW